MALVIDCGLARYGKREQGRARGGAYSSYGVIMAVYMGKVWGADFWAYIYGGFFGGFYRGGAVGFGRIFEKYQKKCLTCFI